MNDLKDVETEALREAIRRLQYELARRTRDELHARRSSFNDHDLPAHEFLRVARCAWEDAVDAGSPIVITCRGHAGDGRSFSASAYVDREHLDVLDEPGKVFDLMGMVAVDLIQTIARRRADEILGRITAKEEDKG